jgi:regulator of sigma E protease
LATVALVLSYVIYTLEVVFGLGFVIFIHELGHFLAAKWAGVKVEKFFLGFDPYGLRVATFRRGETLYGIGAIPLGGYVKMLGEGGEAGEGVAEPTDDPRAFSNKSVGARTVILSAGVVMNLILGLVLFTIAYRLGVKENPAILGAVEAGSPAYEAGLRPGDEIVAINGKGDVNFFRLKMKTSLSTAGSTLQFLVKRHGVAELIPISVVPQRDARAEMPTIGIAQGPSLELSETKPYDRPPGAEGLGPKPEAFPKGEGKVVEAGPEGGALAKVEDYFDLERIFVAHRDKPVDVMIEAPGPEKDSAPARARLTLPAVKRISLGFRLTPGPVASIQVGSIAEKAGFRKGDRIVKFDGNADFDPLHLPDDIFARAGKPTTFTVERTSNGKTETVELTATPDDSLPDVEPPIAPADPLKLPGLGLAMAIESKVAAVDPKGPAAKAGLAPGATIQGLTIPAKEEGDKARNFVFAKPPAKAKDTVEAGWWFLSALLQDLPKTEVRLTVAGSSKPLAITPEPDPSWPVSLRGLNFMTNIREIPPQPLGPAVQRAGEETVDNVMGIYAMLRGLFSGRISTKNLAGLPRIGGMALQTASMGIVPLLQFLGMLSINLAVLNFLPIPPLDGGQIAFLVAEKIRGKPLPDSALTILMIAGLVLVVFLMLFTILQDIYLMIFG